MYVYHDAMEGVMSLSKKHINLIIIVFAIITLAVNLIVIASG